MFFAFHGEQLIRQRQQHFGEVLIRLKGQVPGLLRVIRFLRDHQPRLARLYITSFFVYQRQPGQRLPAVF